MQNINLYQPGDKRRADGPRPTQMLVGLLALGLVMASHAAWLGWQWRVTDSAAAQAETQAHAAEQTLASLRAGYQEPRLDPALVQRTSDQQAENGELARLSGYLDSLDAQRSLGFVPLLAGLAERHPPTGLWLTRIRLDDGGAELALQGLAQKQDLLPAYLHSLGRSASLSGRTFGHFEIERVPGDLLQFRLASRAAQENHDE